MVASRSRLTGADLPVLGTAGLLLAGLAWWNLHGAGYGIGLWAGGAMILIVLLASLVVLGGTLPRAPRRIELLGAGLLAAFVVWSYLSISWAERPDVAWTAANRSLLYLVVMALFMVLAWSPSAGGVAISGFVVVSSTVALAGLVEGRLGDPSSFLQGRLSYPAGYQNANAAIFLTAFWAAVVLGSRREVQCLPRIVTLTATPLLAGTALLAQSRASVIAFVLTAVFVAVVLPGRKRTAIGVALALAPIVLGWDAIVGVREVAEQGGPTATAAMDEAIRVIAGGVLVVGFAAGGWVIFDRRVHLRSGLLRAIDRIALGGAVLAVLALGAAAAVNDPITKIDAGWREFQAEDAGGGFGKGLGSNRYDFWRVSWNEFTDHPVAGAGADNFQVAYMRHRRSSEEPLYPHSVLFQIGSQLGIVGIGLALGALVALGIAVMPRVRDQPEVVPVAAAACAGSVYWLAHASADWFFEIPGTAAPVFGLVGLAAAVRDPVPSPVSLRPAVRIWAVVAAFVAVCALAVPWYEDRLVRHASAGWPADPVGSERALRRAARLNPFSPTPDTISALIAIERDNPEHARSALDAALRRDPSGWYLHFQRALVASWQGDTKSALVEIQRAASLNPRDPLVARVARRLAAGDRVTPSAVATEIARRRADRTT